MTQISRILDHQFFFHSIQLHISVSYNTQTLRKKIKQHTSSSSSRRTRFKATISWVSLFLALKTVPQVPEIEDSLSTSLFYFDMLTLLSTDHFACSRQSCLQHPINSYIKYLCNIRHSCSNDNDGTNRSTSVAFLHITCFSQKIQSMGHWNNNL